MEKKLTNSGPLREPADKHSIYTLPQLLRMMSVMLAIGKETRNISDEIANKLMYIDLLKRKLARSRVTVKVWFRSERLESEHF